MEKRMPELRSRFTWGKLIKYTVLVLAGIAVAMALLVGVCMAAWH